MNEEGIIQAAIEGDTDAFRRLYEIHRERIYRLAYHYTRRLEDAEDILQETFIRAFRAIGRFNTERGGHFSAWIARICINCSIEYLRRCKREGKDRMVLLSKAHSEPLDVGNLPDESVHSQQILRLIEKAVEKLSAKQRVIFELRYTQQWKISEIAEAMGSSESSVKTHLDRSVQKLRKQLRAILEAK